MADLAVNHHIFLVTPGDAIRYLAIALVIHLGSVIFTAIIGVMAGRALQPKGILVQTFYATVVTLIPQVMFLVWFLERVRVR